MEEVSRIQQLIEIESSIGSANIEVFDTLLKLEKILNDGRTICFDFTKLRGARPFNMLLISRKIN